VAWDGDNVGRPVRALLDITCIGSFIARSLVRNNPRKDLTCYERKSRKMTTDSLEKALPTPMTVVLKGVTYSLKQATIGDYLALQDFIRSKRIKAFLASAQGLSADERKGVLTDLASQTISEAELLYEAVTAEGLIFMLWRSLRHSNPELKFEEMNDLLDDETIEDLTTVMKTINTPDEDDSKNLDRVETGSDGTI